MILCTLSVAKFFSPGLFCYFYIDSPNPKNLEGSTPQAPNPINWKPQPQKNPNQDANPKTASKPP